MITFCISTHNNLNYLKLAVRAVRRNAFYKNAPFIIYSENSTDGTNEWLERHADNYNLEYYIEFNKEENMRGIAGGMNFCADKVRTEVMDLLHSDMYIARNQDLEALNIIERHPDERLVVSSFRIQPNIFNERQRPGIYICPRDQFGEYWHNFDEIKFLTFSEHFSKTNNFEIRKGTGASFTIRKRDWDHIGGNDPIFTPASFEDIDLFIRMQNEGYRFILTSKSVVYHFGARGSHFPNDDFTNTSTRQLRAEIANKERFIRKWGKMYEFDQLRFVKPMTPAGPLTRTMNLATTALERSFLELRLKLRGLIESKSVRDTAC